MDAQVPDQNRRKKRPAPREPMQGGSDCVGLGDDVAVAADVAVGACDCGGFPLLKLSFLLTVAALLLPASAARPVGGVIRAYQRHLTRFTPACPMAPSCSAYALRIVRRLGARRGLAAAAARVRTCGATSAPAPTSSTARSSSSRAFVRVRRSTSTIEVEDLVQE
jgi:putative component of membrane protein insertase Oxa1/YidC/SpoIIIJ protein YidD